MKITPQNADQAVISFLLDPLNNYTWMEAAPNVQTIADFKEALAQESSADLARASELADWPQVMKALRAVARVLFP